MTASSGTPEQREHSEPSAETIGRLRAGYEAFARGDVDTLISHLHPDVEFHNPVYAIEAGVRHGRAGFRKAIAALGDMFDYETIELEEIIPAGDQVIGVMRVRATGKGSGVPIDETFAHLWTFRDGLGARVEWYRTLAEAREAARGMAPRDDVETVRRMYEVLDGDLDALLRLVDPEVEFVNPEDAIDQGTRRGHEGMRAAFEGLSVAFEEYHHEPNDFIPVGDKIVVSVTFRARGRESGAELRHEEAHLLSVRDGLVVRFEWFRDLPAALEAAGRPGPSP
jgi:uncharacterized protein